MRSWGFPLLTRSKLLFNLINSCYSLSKMVEELESSWGIRRQPVNASSMRWSRMVLLEYLLRGREKKRITNLLWVYTWHSKRSWETSTHWTTWGGRNLWRKKDQGGKKPHRSRRPELIIKAINYKILNSYDQSLSHSNLNSSNNIHRDSDQ